MSTISLESDDKFNEFMLFLLVADQIHDFTDKKRLKDPNLVYHLDKINENIQSGGNSSFKNLSQANKKTRKRSRSTSGKNHIDTRVNKYTRKHSKKHSRKHSRKHSPLTGDITRKRYRSTSGGPDKRSREPSIDDDKRLNSLSFLSASSVGTMKDDVDSLDTLMDDEDDDTTTTLMDDDTDTEDSDNVAALITSTLATLLPPDAENPVNNSIENFCDKINDINTQLKTNEDYYDGDITMYLLQLLGSFEDEEIRDKYNESDNNFFKFFIPKIKGGAPKNKQNDELNNIKKKIEQLKDISFKDKNDFIKKLNLDNNYKKMIERNPSNNELYRKKIEEYKTNLGTKKEKINELKLQISDFDTKYNKELSYQNLFKIKTTNHLNEHNKWETREILYNIMDLNELIDKFIEVLQFEIDNTNFNIDTEIILNRVGIMSLNNLKINYNKYKDDRRATLDVDQKEAVDKIGELIKGVADVINPIIATSATSGISNYKKLYDICKQGTNIENKIKNLVEPIYKNKKPSSIDNTGKAIIINNGSHNFKKLINHCIYTSACNIDAGSHVCPIKETQGMKLKIESPNKENYIDILLDKSDYPSVTVKIKLEQLNDTEYTDTYQTDEDNKEITLQKVYINVLKLFLERIKTNNFTWPLLSKDEDKEFIGNFIARYSIKTLGDFLQEVNAGIKGGGYIKTPQYTGDTKDFQAIKITDKRQDIDRIYMVNDKLSYCRFLAMRSLFPKEKINEKAYAILDTTSTTIQTINNIISNYGIKQIMHT